MVKALIKGFEGFRNNYFSSRNSLFKNLVKRGQTPKTMVICCSDSRVDPAILFGVRPGELFIVRNVANLVPPYKPDNELHGVSAALEFGVRDLGVSDIVVLGHAFCGGIAALSKKIISEGSGSKKNESVIKDREFINSWIEIAKPALSKVNFDDWPGTSQHEAERLAIRNSIENLQTFPWIATAVQEKKLDIHGWWFDMENGALWGTENISGDFIKLVPNKE